MQDLNKFLLEIVWELYEVLPYFILGVLLEAWIRTKKWHLKIRKTLTSYGFAAIGVAAVLGVVSPLCACGILPLTISMMMGGLPLAPAMTILVASPLMSPAGYAMALKNVGPMWANAEILGAIFMGLYAGLIVHFFESRGFNTVSLFKKELPKGDFHDQDYPDEMLRCHCNDMFSKRVEKNGGGPVSIFLAKAWEGGVKVGKYLILGVAIGSAVKIFLPPTYVDSFLTSKSPLAALSIAIFAIPMHFTQITTTAILYSFQDIPVSYSSGMALLIGGPVTAIPVMAAFISLFKFRVFLLYLTVCISGTLIWAFAFQAFMS